MNTRDLIGKRALITTGSGFGGQTVEEVRLLEVSPSGQWVKLMNLYGKKYWKPRNAVTVAEVLDEIVTEAKPE